MFWVKKVTAASFALAVVFGLGVGAGVSVREVPGAIAADGPTATASTPAQAAVSIEELEAQLAKLRKELMVATISNTNAQVEIAFAKANLMAAQATGDPRTVDPLRVIVTVAENHGVVRSLHTILLKERVRDLEAKLLAAKAAQPKLSTTPIVPAPQSREEIQSRLKRLRDDQSGAKEVQMAASAGVRLNSERVALFKQSGTPKDLAEALETLKRFEESRDAAKKRGDLLQEAIAALEAQQKAAEPPPPTPTIPANPSKEKAVKGQILQLQIQITKLKEDHARFEKMSQDVAAARDEATRQLAELNKQLDEIARESQRATAAASLQEALELATRNRNARTEGLAHLELTIVAKDAKWPFQVREIGADGKSAGAIGFENAAVLGRFVALAAKGPSAPSVLQIRIQADVPYALLITTIETCKAAGIKGFRLELDWASDLGEEGGPGVPKARSDPRATEQQELKRRIESFRKLMEEHDKKPKDAIPPPLLKP
jgi:hypothetical protein